MPKLKTLPSRLSAPPGRLSFLPKVDGPGRNPLAHLYKTAKWQRVRWRVLERDTFTCQRCGRSEARTERLVADHIDPHRGDPVKFWDDANLQCLCKPCHDGPKQRAEAADRRGRGA